MKCLCRKAALFSLVSTLIAISHLAGCRIFHTSRAPALGDSVEPLTLTLEEEALAEALARFGMGVLSESLPDSEPSEHYSRAAELQPDSVIVSLRLAAAHARNGNREAAIAALKDCCDQNPTSPDAFLNLAQLYQSFDQMEEALSAASRATQLDPKNHKAYLRLALINLGMGRRDEAIQALKEALPETDNSLELLLSLGDIYTQSAQSSSGLELEQNLSEAIFYYETALQRLSGPHSLMYWHRLGDLYLMQGNAEPAAKAFEQIVAKSPNDSQALKKLALYYMTLNEKEKAVLALKKIVQIEPDLAEAHFYLGKQYEDLGNIEKAIASYKVAARLSYASSPLYLRLAQLLVEADPKEAMRTLEEGLRLMPDDQFLLAALAELHTTFGSGREASASQLRFLQALTETPGAVEDMSLEEHLAFGLLALIHQQPEKAAFLYKRAILAYPEEWQPYYFLAIRHVKNDDVEQAIAVVKEAVSAVRNKASAFPQLGHLFMLAGRFDEAVSVFDFLWKTAQAEGLSLGDDFYFVRGAALERTGEVEAAEPFLLKALDLNPENAEAFNYLAYVWAERGKNLELAYQYVRHALDLDPNNPAYLDTLAWILHKQGKHSLALDYIENALFFLGDDPVIFEHMGAILMAIGREKEAIDWWKYSLLLDPANESVRRELLSRGIDPDELLHELKTE